MHHRFLEIAWNTLMPARGTRWSGEDLRKDEPVVFATKNSLGMTHPTASPESTDSMTPARSSDAEADSSMTSDSLRNPWIHD